MAPDEMCQSLRFDGIACHELEVGPRDFGWPFADAHDALLVGEYIFERQ